MPIITTREGVIARGGGRRRRRRKGEKRPGDPPLHPGYGERREEIAVARESAVSGETSLPHFTRCASHGIETAFSPRAVVSIVPLMTSPSSLPLYLIVNVCLRSRRPISRTTVKEI